MLSHMSIMTYAKNFQVLKQAMAMSCYHAAKHIGPDKVVAVNRVFEQRWS